MAVRLWLSAPGRMARRGHVRSVSLLLAGVLLAAGCSGGADELKIEHVHGIDVTADELYVATHFGLFVREGEEWSRRSEDRHDHMGFSLVSSSLAFRSGHPEGGGNLGVQRSTDGGRTWETVSDVLDTPVDFHAMAAGPADEPALYGWSGALFRAPEDPEVWETAPGRGLPEGVGALTVSPAGHVYASTAEGVYRSTDQGGTWERTSGELLFALAAADEDTIYGSSAQGSGVLRSTDEGRTWTQVSGPEDAGVIVALGASADDPTVVAANGTGAIWQSDDGGESWSRVPPP